MNRCDKTKLAACLLVIVGVAVPAVGQIAVPGADGSDYEFHPYGNITINLASAVNLP